jgi:hypothetical protein
VFAYFKVLFTQRWNVITYWRLLMYLKDLPTNCWNMLSHVRGSVTNITGSGLVDWIYWHFFTVTINYNSSRLRTVSDSLHFLLDYEHLLVCVTDLVLIYESVTSSASVVHDWTLNSLTNKSRMIELSKEISWRTEYRSQSPTVRALLCFIRCHRNMFRKPLASNASVRCRRNVSCRTVA